MQAIQVIRFLTVLCRRGGYPYWAYDSFARANADALGTTEARGPLGLVRRRFAWTTIGGDLDISGGTVVGGDAQANVVPNPGFETGGTGGTFNGGAEVDDGVSDNFDSWTETNVNDGAGDKVEATATMHGGNYAVKITSTIVYCYPRQNPIAGAVAGQLYDFAFWQRGNATVNGWVTLRSGGDVLVNKGTGYKGAVYTLFRYIVAASTGTTTFDLLVRQDATGGIVYFDDVAITPCHAEYIDPGQADVVYRADLTTPAAGANPAGLILRRNGATQWLVQMTPGTAGTDFELIELNNGAPISRASADRDFAINTIYHIAVALTGQSIIVYEDGVQRLSYATAAVGLTNTQFGIWDSAAANFEFDNVEITEYGRYPHAGGY